MGGQHIRTIFLFFLNYVFQIFFSPINFFFFLPADETTDPRSLVASTIRSAGGESLRLFPAESFRYLQYCEVELLF